MMSGLFMKYFVLKPGGDDAYATASRKAMMAYARAIEDENIDLAKELIQWVGHENGESLQRKMERGEVPPINL